MGCRDRGKRENTLHFARDLVIENCLKEGLEAIMHNKRLKEFWG
jgi:hypothetical protein